MAITVRNELGPVKSAQRGTGMSVTNMTERANDVGGTARIGRDGEHWLGSPR